jgi:hypothetical protein
MILSKSFLMPEAQRETTRAATCAGAVWGEIDLMQLVSTHPESEGSDMAVPR